MNVFFEFYKIVKSFREEKIDYALIGGVAIAFYSEPRFTKDIDILLTVKDFGSAKRILNDAGYFESSPPWFLIEKALVLFRFMKIRDNDEMIVDILVAKNKKFEKIIENAQETVSAEAGVIRIASKKDLIWLKEQRNSLQDKADIERLKNEQP